LARKPGKEGLDMTDITERAPARNSDDSRDQDRIPFHPLADILPLMEGEEFDALVADIKANGLHDPLVMYEGKILDGRNRYRAAIKAGVDPFPLMKNGKHCGALNYVGDDPAGFVISRNIHRRHLTTEQKRDLIARLLTADPSKSDRQIAKQAKASPTFVGKVRAEGEATGDVSTVDTRTDSKGRKQPAKKPPRRPAKKKWDVIHERQGLVRLLFALDRDLAVLLSKFFETYPDQVDGFVADLMVCRTEIEECNEGRSADDDPDASAGAMKAGEAATGTDDDGLDIPECLRRSAP
jgi:hypothetical protein